MQVMVAKGTPGGLIPRHFRNATAVTTVTVVPTLTPFVSAQLVSTLSTLSATNKVNELDKVVLRSQLRFFDATVGKRVVLSLAVLVCVVDCRQLLFVTLP